MIRQLFFCLTISLSACGQKNTLENIDKQSTVSEDSLLTFSITKATIEDFTEAKNIYNNQFVHDTLNVSKVNGVIEIPLHRPHYPPSVVFKDTLVDIGETEEKVYQYLGHFPDLDYYLVSGTFWEHYECYLINKETGRKTTTWNRPFLSPKSTYFANLSMPYGLEGIPNGLQVWKFDKSQQEVNKIFELDQQFWAPEDFVWENEVTIILKVVSVDKFWESNGEVNNNDYHYLRLKLK